MSHKFYLHLEKDNSLWLINLETEVPSALNHTSLLKAWKFDDDDTSSGPRPTDLDQNTIVYKEESEMTLEEFLQVELGAKHIKTIRENSKLVFSTNLPFCDWISKQKDEKCTNYAHVYNSQKKPMCKRHYAFYK